MALRFYKSRPRPSMDEIIDLKSDYTDWHQRRIQKHREDESFFTLQYEIPSPDGRSALKSPSGYQVVEDLINHMVAEYPTFNVMPRSQDESELRRSGKLTSWVGGFWRKIELTRILRQMLFHDAVFGCHVLRVMTDFARWPEIPERPDAPAEPDFQTASPGEIDDYIAKLLDYEEARESYKGNHQDYLDYTEEHLPFVVEPIDPRYCFWEPTRDPERLVIAWDRTIDDILQAHPYAWSDLGNIKPGTKIQWCEYHDAFDSAYWVESYGSYGRGQGPVTIIQEPHAHGYGFFPFCIDGPWVTPLEDSDKRYPSLYFAIKAMLKYESTLLTQMAHMIRVNGWAPLIVKTDREGAMKPVISLEPGAINYIEQEEAASYLEFSGQTMTVLERLINAVDAYTQKGSGLGDILKGQPKGKSGYQQAQIAAMARVALVPVEQSTQRTLQTASRFILKMIRSLEDWEKITVVNSRYDGDAVTSIGPRDVTRFGEVQVQMRTVLPVDEGAKIANISNMQKQGWLSRVSAARMAGVENPEDERARAEAETIANQPEIIQAQALIWAQEHWPELAQIIQGMMQQQQQKAKGPPQVGPGGPGGAGGGAKLNQPGRPRPTSPGSQQEQEQMQAQQQTGGMPQRRLREGADQGEGE